MCYIRNETEPEGDLSYMSTTAKERFDQMMERCENLHLMYAGCVVFAVRKGKCVI